MTVPGREAARALMRLLERYPLVLPLLILAAGAVFRFYNLNWDSGNTLHPDERFIYETVVGGATQPGISWPTSIGQFFDIAHGTGSPLDPHNFNYGTLPFYLLAFVAGAVSLAGQHLPGLSTWADVSSYGGLPGLGRGLSGLMDLLSVWLVFLIGRRAFGYWTGVLAMAFTAFTVLDVQLSHFYTVDTILTPLVLATLLAAVTFVQTGDRRTLLLGGVAFGAAMATKTTAVLLVAPLGAAAVLGAWNSVSFPGSGTVSERLRRHYSAVAASLNRNLLWTFACLGIGAVTFVVCEPYALLDRSQLLLDIQQQTTFLVTNNPPFAVPYTIQYAHTTPYLYQLKNMLFWTLGIPLGVAAFAGFAYFLLRNLLIAFRALTGKTLPPGVKAGANRGTRPATRKAQPAELVLLLWVIPYFIVVGTFFAKFNRYMLPITPVLGLLGAALLVRLLTRMRSIRRVAAGVAVALVVGISFLYCVAYMNIYANPNTRVAASAWIYQHIPRGSRLIGETNWDDALPLAGSNGQTSASMGYQLADLTNHDMYAGENTRQLEMAKINGIIDLLQHHDYFIMSSERIIGSIPHLRDRFAVAIRFYDLLFGNRLNYRLVASFEQHPQLGPVTVADFGADESFHVYDHPYVRIFKRVGSISAGRIRTLLTTGLAPAADPTAVDTSWVLKPKRATADNRLILSASQWQADQQGQTMAQMFPANGLGMQHPLLVWWIVLELLGLLALPFCFLLFSRLLDRGFVVSKTIGMVLLGFGVWITVSVGAHQYTRGLILFFLGVMAVLAALLAYRMRAAILAEVRAHWKYMLAGELVFLAGFALLIVLRSMYPDLGHQYNPGLSATNLGSGHMGEKQMELAYLNGIVRSRVFPPYDPFFAHGYINYYYYGLYLVATFCKLTTIATPTGFNLAIATFFGLLIAGAFTVVLTLTRRLTPAVVAAVFVGIVGNLNGAWQMIQGLMGVAQVHSAVPFFGGVVNTISGLQQVIFAHQALPPFDYWQSRSIFPNAISEFPYFTYIFADLHPHLIAYPLTLAATALAVNLLRGGYAALGPRLLALVVGGILVGAIAATNPWDYPTYLVVVGIGAAAGAWLVRRRLSWPLLTRPVLWVAGLAVLSFLFYLPFKQSYQTVFQTGIGPVRDVSPQAIANDVCPSQNACPGTVRDVLVTPLRIYLEHFGLFLFAIASYLIGMVLLRLNRAGVTRKWLTWLRFTFYYRERLGQVFRAQLAVRRMLRKDERMFDDSYLRAAVIVVAGLVVLGYYLLAFLAAMFTLVLLAAWLVGRRLSAAELFALCIAGLALLISFGTQVFFVKDFLAGGASFRMNTIFKFYDQVWVLMALASAILLYALMAREIPNRPRLRSPRVSQGNPISTSISERTADSSDAGNPTPSGSSTGQPEPRAGGPTRSVPAYGLRVSSPNPGALALAAGELAPAAPAAAIPARVSRWTLPAARLSRLIYRRGLWAATLASLIFGALVYTFAGAAAHQAERSNWISPGSLPATLDGMAFMKVAYPSEYAAINWMNAHIAGAPVIAEAGPSGYDWRSRVSMFTGLPTIYNGIHEDEQRYADEIDPTANCASTQDPQRCSTQLHGRVDDLTTLYSSTSQAEKWRVIHTYGVRYIFVGIVEKLCVTDPNINPPQCYSRAGLNTFSRMVGHGLQVAYNRRGVTIYRVVGA